MKNNIKTIVITALIIITHCSLVIAQVPQTIPYQAVARNAAGNLITNQNISLKFSIKDMNSGGNVVYSETQTATTNPLGLFTAAVGNGTPVTGTFSGINWSTIGAVMKVEMDPAGGTSYIDMGTQQMRSVPYALHAATSKASETAIAPSMTTIQRDVSSPVPGMMIFNTTTHKFQGCTDTLTIIGSEVTDVSNITTGSYYYPSWYGDSLAQSFTVVNSGLLKKIELNAQNIESYSGTYYLEIYNGNTITGTVVSLTTGIDIPTEGVISILLASPLQVFAGAQYTFRIVISSGSTSIVEFKGSNFDSYAGGNVWKFGSPSFGDLWFKTYVETPSGFISTWVDLH